MRGTWLVMLLVALTAMPACAPDGGDDLAPDGGPGTVGGGKADGDDLPLRFLPGELFLPTAIVTDDLAAVFRSEADLESTLQIDNPGIDFDSEWAVFYTPGVLRPDLEPGFQARIDTVRLSQSGLTLMTYVATLHNGDCPDRPSRPFILVGIPIPDDPPPYTQIHRHERTRDCADDWSSYDGVWFSPAQAADALDAANKATAAELDAVDIRGAQANLLIDGRTWGSLGAVAQTPGIGTLTLTRLRELGAQLDD